ncbi:MAG: YggU family protein [Candidatus Thermoplasmatota archaeon]|nr:YggU family protein [Candidatus Thermoplasmatota archaeon]
MTSFKDAIKKTNQGVLLCLHVVPSSSQVIFPAAYNQWRKSLEMKVTSEPKDNKANTEVRETIAGFFNLSIQDVVLVSGGKSRDKTVCVKKISFERVIDTLQECFHG